MTKIRTLENTELPVIHAAFIDAFSEYEVKMDLPIERLADMMNTRNYRADISLGAFEDGELAGFVLAGYREMAGSRIAYDVATGSVRAFQKQGIGDALLKELRGILSEKRIDRFQLEVLEHNEAAQKLYERNGFTRTRKLMCWELRREQGEKPVSTDTAIRGDTAAGTPEAADAYRFETSTLDELAGIPENEYIGYLPAWQNDLRSARPLADKYRVELARDREGVAAYGIVHRERGDILQLGVRPGVSGTALARTMLDRLAEATASSRLSLLNVEEGSELNGILAAYGFSNFINQYEMSADIRPRTLA